MNRKEKIYEFIKSNLYVPLKQEELAVLLDVPKNDMEEFISILDELASEGKIYITKKGKYIATEKDNEVFDGVLSCNSSKGFGFVRCENSDDDIFIPLSCMGGAYDRDRVLVRIDKKAAGTSRREGHIIKVLSRGNTQIVGVISGYRSGKYIALPDRREFFAEISIPTERAMNAKKGDRVLIGIDGYSDKATPCGTVIMVLGKKDDIKGCLDGLLYSNSYSKTFPEDVTNECNSISDCISEDDIKNREDLRNLMTFTIDGETSRDFDDAVSLEIADNSNYILGVHIADVTHYVKENSPLDKEALSRATSVYFPHMVIPMLPEKLSNGICSLNPNEDRLTLSVFMEFDQHANMHNNRISLSVIRSHARFTYGNVNKILDGEAELCDKYCEFVPVLTAMNALSEKLAEKRRNRGAIDFDFPETQIICDDNAIPIEVTNRERGASERMIESFMLAANETVAETAFWSELPFVYRVHEAPTNEKLTEFNGFIKNFGYSIKGTPERETIHPKELQTIAEAVKGTPEEMMISKIMLRSLMKACYRDTNEGHFGLAARYYCHFTSPIRRYPDLFIHRVLKNFLLGTLSYEKRPLFIKSAAEAASVSSEKEVMAENTERDAIDLLKAAYMKNCLGETFSAVISSVTSFGIFAMLDNSCEGLIRYETMQSDYFCYEENNHTATGMRSGKEYKIGDLIEITVAAADVLSRRIDFILAEDASFRTIKQIAERQKPITLKKETKKRSFGRKKHKRNRK